MGRLYGRRQEKEEIGADDMTFTLSDIKTAWKSYQEAKCLCVLKNGAWGKRVLKSIERIGKIEGTRAEVRDLKSIMGFPEYMEKEWIKPQ